MALEIKWQKVEPKPLTANGGSNGYVYVSDVKGFKIRQKVKISATGLETIQLDIINVYPNYLVVGNFENKRPVDVSAYTTALSASISADEQEKKYITHKEIIQYVYDAEPINAIRTHNVDEEGNSYNVQNPLPVQLSDGSINIGTVNGQLEVQLSHMDNVPDVGDVADSVQVGDGTTTIKVDEQNRSISSNRYEKLLGLLANSNWMKNANFEAINPIFDGDLATLEYMQDNAIIGRAFFTFVIDNNWNIVLEKYINNPNGAILLDDDGSELFLD